MNDDFVTTDFKNPFVHHYYEYLPCATTQFAEGKASYLTKNNHKLYATVGKNIFVYNLTAMQPMVDPQKIDTLHEGAIIEALASKKNSMLYSIGKKNSSVIKLWNTDSDEYKGELLHTIAGEFTSLAEDDNGNPCATDSMGNIIIWDISTANPKQFLRREYSNVDLFHLVADTHMICAAGGMGGLLRNGPILMYDTRTEKCIDAINLHRGQVIHLAKSKKDMCFYSSSFDNTIRIWDMRNMKDSVYTLENNEYVWCIEENDDGTLFFTCGDTGVYVWDLTAEKPAMINTLSKEKARCMAQDIDGARLFIGTEDAIKVVSADCTFDDACVLLNKRFEK